MNLGGTCRKAMKGGGNGYNGKRKRIKEKGRGRGSLE